MSDARANSTIVALDPPVLCPHCGHLLDEALIDHPPIHGELGVCLYCATPVRWRVCGQRRPALVRLSPAAEERARQLPEIQYWLHLCGEFHHARQEEREPARAH